MPIEFPIRGHHIRSSHTSPFLDCVEITQNMMSKSHFDAVLYLDVMSRTLGIEVDFKYRQNVIFHLERAAALASLLSDVEVPNVPDYIFFRPEWRL